MARTRPDDRAAGRPGFPLGDASWFHDLERTEERCRRYLEELRWPAGVRCPQCRSGSVGEIPARRRYYCRGCRHHFSATSGTAFHRSHLPLWKWFAAISLLLECETGLPANQLVQLLGGSYKTAWFVAHRIRAALVHGHAPGDGRYAGSAPGRVIGPYHQVGERYLAAYEAERRWRERNRANPRALEETLLALLAAGPVPYRRLVGAPAVA
jgi:transposase-like protein